MHLNHDAWFTLEVSGKPGRNSCVVAGFNIYLGGGVWVQVKIVVGGADGIVRTIRVNEARVLCVNICA